MPDPHRVAMLLLHPGTPGDQEAWTSLRDALPGAETTRPDELGTFEVVVEADDQEQALERVWDAVAASGSDDHIAFLEHPELPDHWRERSRPSGA